VIAARRVRGVGSSPTSPRRLDPALRGWVGGWEWGVGGGGGYCHHVSDVSAPVRQAAAATRPLFIVTTCPTCRPQSGRPLPPRDRYCHHVSDVSAPVREAAAATRPLLSPRVRRVGPSPGGRCRHATVTSPPRVRRGGSCPEGRRRLQVHLRPTSCLLPSCQTRRTQGVWRGSTCPDDSSDRLWRGVVWTRGDTSDTWKSILLRAYEVSEEGVRRV